MTTFLVIRFDWAMRNITGLVSSLIIFASLLLHISSIFVHVVSQPEPKVWFSLRMYFLVLVFFIIFKVICDRYRLIFLQTSTICEINRLTQIIYPNSYLSCLALLYQSLNTIKILSIPSWCTCQSMQFPFGSQWVRTQKATTYNISYALATIWKGTGNAIITTLCQVPDSTILN